MRLASLTAESVQGTALALESVDNIHSCHGLPLGMLSVGDGITDNVLKENLEYTSGLFVDQAADSLYTTTTCKTTDSWLGDTLDVITQNLAMTLGASLSKTLASFASSRHVVSSISRLRMKSWPDETYISSLGACFADNQTTPYAPITELVKKVMVV